MKIECHILSVEDAGDALLVTMQGTAPSSPLFFGWQKEIIKVPNTEPARKAYYVGRRVDIDVSPVTGKRS